MNSKILILFVVVLVVGLTAVNAGPVYSEEEWYEFNYPGDEMQPGPRQKRVTCDLLSASFKGTSINDSACAAHCLVQRFKGGHCQNGVCHCRR